MAASGQTDHQLLIVADAIRYFPGCVKHELGCYPNDILSAYVHLKQHATVIKHLALQPTYLAIAPDGNHLPIHP